jgi:hypothetical protein
MNASKALGALGLFVASLACSAAPARADLFTVPLTTPPLNNDIRMNPDGAFYPSAPTTLTIGGVPFDLRPLDAAPNTLGVGFLGSPADTPFDIKTNFVGATTVYTLINSGFGQAPFTVGTVEFKGANGSDVTFDLTEGFNIRDHFFSTFNNTVTDPTIVTATFGPGGLFNEDRLDRQTFVLPASFANDTLTDIIFAPTAFTGDPAGEPFLAAVTVEAPAVVPEPATFALLTSGLGVVGLFFRRGGR